MRKYGQEAVMSEEDIEWLIAHRGEAASKLQCTAPEKAIPIWGLYACWETEGDKAILEDYSACGQIISENHSVIAYNDVLTLGIDGILEKIEICRQKNGDSSFYRGCSRVWKAFGNFCHRYGEEASRLAARETNPLRRAELETIASDCTYISSYPPVNFRQAVQAVWFSHILNTFEDHINANSVGRLDQILYPFFMKDLEAGTITKEEAYELICCLWIKLYQYPDLYPADPRI